MYKEYFVLSILFISRNEKKNIYNKTGVNSTI